MNKWLEGATDPARFQMRRQSRTFFVYSLVSCIAMACCGCNSSVRRSGIPAGAQTALDTAIEDVDAGRYDKLYQEASDEWRGQSSLEASKATFQKLRDRLGNARTRTQETAREEQTSTGPVAGHSVTVIYQTTFDRGEGIETFTLVERGGRWTLAKYYVSSSGLT
ncbi:MAG: DUF4019 domain-containing protein [Pyrinomonadaceae bacterium]